MEDTSYSQEGNLALKFWDVHDANLGPKKVLGELCLMQINVSFLCFNEQLVRVIW